MFVAEGWHDRFILLYFCFQILSETLLGSVCLIASVDQGFLF